MLANTVLLLALGALTSAQQFKDFPSVLTCQTGDGTTTVDIPQEVSQKAVVRGSGGPAGTLMEESAANASSGKCTRLAGIPYFVVRYPLLNFYHVEDVIILPQFSC